MNNNKTAIAILFFILAGAIAFFGLTYFAKPKKEEKVKIENENVGLRATRDELEAENRHKAEYEAEIKENTDFFYQQLEAYPGDLNQDMAVMFMKNIQKTKGTLNFELNTVDLNKPELIYTVSAPMSDEFGNSQYECYRAQYPTAYQGNYEGLKAVIDDVMAYQDRMIISGFDMVYDPLNDIYTGSLTFYGFSVNGNGREVEQADVNVKKGKNNPFLDGEGSGINVSSHDADNGASIIDSHDAKLEINNANGDASEGVVLSANGTVVSDATNDVLDVTVKLEEVDGKVTVTYTLGSETITSDFTGNELDIFVSASERVNSDDKNGVNLTIDNSTSVAVFIKVNGDDASSPRFKLGSKSGSVKVY